MRRRVRAGFEPPAYIASLIASINDGAKAAQTGGLFMLAVAVYLMATVISTTDEVLLRGSFVEFSQLGVKVPVVASYALVPIVFLFLHMHTLIRYDMLAENLRLLDRELHTSLAREPDRDRCRQLLANVELVQYQISPRDSHWHSLLYRVVVWVMLVAVPVLVFLATQISFLRYQSSFVTYVVHLSCLALDLAALVYFWYRQARRRQDWQPRGQARTLVLNGLPAILLFAFAVVYLGIPGRESTTTGREADEDVESALADAGLAWQAAFESGDAGALASTSQSITATIAGNLWKHPLDLGACPLLGWGCRYLRLDHRLLVEERPDGDVLFKLRMSDRDLKQLLIRIEALFLRDRSFRFANFEASEFYDADLRYADLAHVRLSLSSLQGARLIGAQMQGANLGGAQMQGSDLRDTLMQGANLFEAQMQGVDLSGAQMQGANLRRAKMQGVNLSGAEIQGADLSEAEMQGADLWRAQMQGVDLSGAEMQGVDLSGAQMQGANLRRAKIQGADLSGADMQGADLRGAALWRVVFNGSDLSLADLRQVDFSRLDDFSPIVRTFDLIPDEGRRAEVFSRVTQALTPTQTPTQTRWRETKTAADAVVDAPDHPFMAIKEQMTTDQNTYDIKLAAFLVELARADANVARAFAARVAVSPRLGFENGDRRLWPNLARRLLAAEAEGRFALDPQVQEELQTVVRASDTNPPPLAR